MGHSGRSRPLVSGSQVSGRVVYVAKSSGFTEQKRDTSQDDGYLQSHLMVYVNFYLILNTEPGAETP